MSFYVTLPSNTTSPSSNNTQAAFTTNLGRQIELKGVYEVGLVEFSYTQEIELDLGLMTIEVKNKIINIDIKVQEHTKFETLLNRINTKIINSFYDNNITTTNALEIVKKDIPYFRIINNDDFIFSIPANISIKCNNKKLADVLGFEEYKAHANSHEFLYDIKYQFINTIDSFLVYCNIVENQYYGDKFSSILRNVIPKGITGDKVSIIYDNPHYVDLKYNNFDNITINIRDSTGNLIHFNDLSGKVIVKLHFKKKYGNI